MDQSIDLKKESEPGVSSEKIVVHSFAAPVFMSSDSLPEGKNNLYFTPDRAKDVCLPLMQPMQRVLEGKQDKISSADEVPGGLLNKYFSESLVRAILAPKIQMLLDEIGKKQDKIKDSDDIPEGKSNLFFPAEELKLELSKVIDQLMDYSVNESIIKTDALRQSLMVIFDTYKRESDLRLFTLESAPKEDLKPEIELLKKEIAELKELLKSQPKEQQHQVMENNQMVGDSRTLKLVTQVTASSIQYREVEIRGGKIARIFPATVLPITKGD